MRILIVEEEQKLSAHIKYCLEEEAGYAVDVAYDSVLDLADREYALLEYLMRNPNRLITREMIIAHLWNSDHVIASNVVDVYLCRLRAKVDHPYMNKLIETIRGVGYRLRDPERSE